MERHGTMQLVRNPLETAIWVPWTGRIHITSTALDQDAPRHGCLVQACRTPQTVLLRPLDSALLSQDKVREPLATQPSSLTLTAVEHRPDSSEVAVGSASESCRSTGDLRKANPSRSRQGAVSCDMRCPGLWRSTASAKVSCNVAPIHRVCSAFRCTFR